MTNISFSSNRLHHYTQGASNADVKQKKSEDANHQNPRESGLGKEENQGSLIDHMATPNRSIIDKLSIAQSSRLEKLMERETELSKPVENETLTEHLARKNNLQQVRVQIEIEVIDVLENELLNSPLGEDGGLNRDDLQALANHKLRPKSVRIAAQYMLDNTKKLNQLEGPDTTLSIFEKKYTLIRDDVISLSDTHRRTNELGDAHNNVEFKDIPTDYKPPTDAQLDNNYPLDTPNLEPRLYSDQQDAVASAIRTGESVSFMNSDGQKLAVAINRLPSTSSHSVNYNVQLSDGTQFTVSTEIGIADTVEAIANIVEWGTTSDFGPGVRRFPDYVNFFADKGNFWAFYNATNNVMSFFDGTKYIDEEVYYHEMGHGIGYQLNSDKDTETGQQRIVPDGYEDVLKAAMNDGIGGVTSYGNTNAAEDFSESLAAYMNARENGSEALAEFKIAYPHRSAYIEQYVFGQQPKTIG